MIEALGTYLPVWGTAAGRVLGEDEDVVTMAVAAGLAALAPGGTPVDTVVLISRDLPLLEGGNGAALLAGLDLEDTVEVREEIGGAPAALEAVSAAGPGTLVIAADVKGGAGAAAARCGPGGVAIASRGRVTRSLPVVTRDASGTVTDYADPRLLRERGVRKSARTARTARPTRGGGRPGPARRRAADRGRACRTSRRPAPAPPSSPWPQWPRARAGGPSWPSSKPPWRWSSWPRGPSRCTGTRPSPGRRPVTRPGGDADIAISLAAYERAFEAKLRLIADRCTTCGTLAYPHRFRCLTCGSEAETAPVALPRQAVIYTLATIHVPVPGLSTPYTVVLAELGDSAVRLLVRLTGAEAGSVGIGDRGRLVLRRVAVRTGVPDYGYAFYPDERTEVAA